MKMKDLVLIESEWDNLPEIPEDEVAARKAAITKKVNAIKDELRFYRDQAFNLRQKATKTVLTPEEKHNRAKAEKMQGECEQMIEKMEKQVKAIQKAFRVKQFANVGVAPQTKEQLHAAEQIPEFVIGKSKIKNPLVSHKNAHWVGPPEQYTELSGSQKDLLLDIQDALKAGGLPPLDTLYGARHNDSSINFLAVNSDRSAAWKKYGSRYGGSNQVYLRGVGGINTGSFVSSPAHYLSKMK